MTLVAPKATALSFTKLPGKIKLGEEQVVRWGTTVKINSYRQIPNAQLTLTLSSKRTSEQEKC